MSASQQSKTSTEETLKKAIKELTLLEMFSPEMKLEILELKETIAKARKELHDISPHRPCSSNNTNEF